MKYDRDLKILRICSVVGFATNAAVGIANAYIHQWIVACACGVWCASCLIFRNSMRANQRTRDEGAAMVAKWREEWTALIMSATTEAIEKAARALGDPGGPPPGDMKDWLN